MSETTASQPGANHGWDTIDQAVREQIGLLLTAGTNLINSSNLMGRLDPISLFPAVLRPPRLPAPGAHRPRRVADGARRGRERRRA